jgi:hypothetical protein
MSAINVKSLLKKWFAFPMLTKSLPAQNVPARLLIRKSPQLFPLEAPAWVGQVHPAAVVALKAASLEADDGHPAVSRIN